jgi:hypothetical protein
MLLAEKQQGNEWAKDHVDKPMGDPFLDLLPLKSLAKLGRARLPRNLRYVGRSLEAP